MIIQALMCGMVISVNATGVKCVNGNHDIEQSKLDAWRRDHSNVMGSLPRYCNHCLTTPQDDEPLNTTGSALNPNFEEEWLAALERQSWVNKE